MNNYQLSKKECVPLTPTNQTVYICLFKSIKLFNPRV